MRIVRARTSTNQKRARLATPHFTTLTIAVGSFTVDLETKPLLVFERSKVSYRGFALWVM